MLKSETKKLLNEIFKNRTSSFLYVRSPKETGKTDFVLWLMEQAYNFGYFKYFGLNQEIENAPFEYDFITDLKTLTQRCIALDKKYFYFLDEIGKSVPKDVPWKKLNLELIQELEIIRKYRLSFAGCSIGDVDRRVINANHVDYYFEKDTLTTAQFYNLRKRYQGRIINIPPTTIKFHEYKVAYFTLEPQAPTSIYDIDVRIAVEWAKGERYTGDLSKQGYYDQVKRGVLKLEKIFRSSSQPTRREVKATRELD